MLLITATWMGVTEEIIEAFFEFGHIIIGAIDAMKDVNNCVFEVLDFIITFFMMIELSAGIYLLSTFPYTLYVTIGIVIQSIFLLVAFVWMCIIILVISNYIDPRRLGYSLLPEAT